jgi:hypothetical protein
MGTWDTRQAPTATQQQAAEIARTELTTLERDVEALAGGELLRLREALDAAGAPWTPRRSPD